jgi:high affinity Mn2+ porin
MTFVRAAVRSLCGLSVLVSMSAAPVQAQEPSSAASADSRAGSAYSQKSGLYIGGQFGAAGGSSGSTHLFHGYDLVDGSGSQFGGVNVGYLHRTQSHLVFGVESDLSFGAEPASANNGFERVQAFGSVRGRVGYGSRRWFTYGTGGFAWIRDQITTDPPIGAAAPPSFTREHAGWTLGAGIERALDARWSANAEYLYTSTSVLSTNQVRAGLHFALGPDPGPGPGGRTDSIVGSLDSDEWNLHGQTTLVGQYAAPFNSPYRGTNSLDPNIARETWDVTFYVGRRLWSGAALWMNPEIDQGYGLSNTLGIGGFSSGEAYKLGYAHPYVRVPRVLVQQTFNLGGKEETVDAGLNQFRETHSANRLVLTAGKFSVSDIFDTISYAHDPRNDFLNWSLVDAGTFDYAADAWGFTYGAAVEWYQGRWAVRGGFFDLSRIPNSAELDTSFGEYQLVYEVERQHTFHDQPGKMAVVGFVSRGRMGRYADALAFAAEHGTIPNTADVRRYGSRPGLNVNVAQQIRPDIGVFARAGWADGGVEAYEFTDIDRTGSAGVSFAGRRWGRKDDTLGVALVVNDISPEHRAYLAAGGLGILVGDGQLPHPGPESIVETYYRVPLGSSWQLSADYQFIVNPAFNHDRGPVSVITARLRAQF